MEKRPFGKTDMMVSVLGFGASEIGFEETDQGTVDQLLGTALDAGLNVIDTAECYKISEELIGNTISHRRDDYYLFTKCGHASGLEFTDWDPKMLELSIDRSLKLSKLDGKKLAVKTGLDGDDYYKSLCSIFRIAR
jgi:aryl-alcohol dehydrogenase-like predicted oxidoreductase